MGLLIEVANIFILLFIGWIGYVMFLLLRFPSPSLLGALFVVGAIKLCGFTIHTPPPYFGISLQILLGLYVGVGVTREVCKQFKKIAIPVVLMSLWAIGVTLIIGYLLARLTGMDRLTAYLGAAPGGLSEISIIALSFNVNVGSVSLLQLCRLVITLIFFPMIARLKTSKEKNEAALKNRAYLFFKQFKLDSIKYFFCENIRAFSSSKVIFTTTLAFLGGSLGIKMGLPAGGMIGSLFTTMLASVFIDKIKLQAPPAFLRNFVRIGIGVLIGNNFSMDLLADFYSMLLPAIIFTMLIFGSSLVMARIIQGITGWDQVTCFLATAPAGFTPLTILASDMGIHPFEVSMLQLARLLTIKSLLPFLLLYLSHS